MALRRFGGLFPELSRFSSFLENPSIVSTAATSAAIRYPALDLAEKATTYEVTADLPGVAPEDLDLRVKDNSLSIKARFNTGARGGGEQVEKGEKGEKGKEEVEEVRGEEEGFWWSRERVSGYGEYQRRLVFPQSINAEKIQAKLENGVLRVVLPKLSADQGGEDYNAGVKIPLS